MMPAMYPNIRFARREGKNAEWEQSWKRINIRTKKPDATTDNSKLIQYGKPWSTEKIISAHRPM
jgi:hypothetical protein